MCHEGQTLDFQSTALPTELPSLRKFGTPRANHGARSLKQKTPKPQHAFVDPTSRDAAISGDTPSQFAPV